MKYSVTEGMKRETSWILSFLYLDWRELPFHIFFLIHLPFLPIPIPIYIYIYFVLTCNWLFFLFSAIVRLPPGKVMFWLICDGYSYIHKILCMYILFNGFFSYKINGFFFVVFRLLANRNFEELGFRFSMVIGEGRREVPCYYALRQCVVEFWPLFLQQVPRYSVVSTQKLIITCERTYLSLVSRLSPLSVLVKQ